ncbi:hypothetical protein [Orrella marina]|uniref:hypothetical protein n=1 Tax=Orrella marina TaxID=2163011 RepID=UPI00131F2AD0|nr:hypothetical protein [Orrella marina]
MTSLSATSVHASSYARANEALREKQSASFKSDVMLVLFWAAMIPGLMWMGSYLGY